MTVLRGGLVAAACVAFAAAATAASPASACEIVVSTLRRGDRIPEPPPLAPRPLPPGSTLVKARVTAATGYRVTDSLDDQAMIFEVTLAVSPIAVGDLPQPEAVLWTTGQCGPEPNPHPVEGREYLMLLERVPDGRWLADVIPPRLFDAYLAGIQQASGADQ